MSCKITFESIITFREYDLLLILHTSTTNVEFYSLSNTLYFIILCYIEQKIYLFLWRPAISSFKCPKKSSQQGSTRDLKVRTLKVKIQYLPQLVPVAVTVEHNSPVSVILHLHLENTACIMVILIQLFTIITHVYTQRFVGIFCWLKIWVKRYICRSVWPLT